MIDEFRAAAAARREQRLLGPGPAHRDLAGGRRDRPVRDRMLHVQAAVHLAQRRGAQVVALPFELAEPPRRVGARGDRLRLDRLDLRVEVRPELDRHDAAQVVLQRRRVDDVQAGPVAQEDLQRPPVAAAEDAHDAAGRLEPQPPPGNPADAVDQEPRPLQDLALDRDPDIVEPLDMKPAASLLRALPVPETPHADPVQPGARVEHRVRRLVEQGRQTNRQLLGLHPIPQRRHLQPMDPRARLPRRREHLERPRDLVAPARLVHQPGRPVAAGHLQPRKIGRKPQPNLLRRRDRRRRRRPARRRRRQQQTRRRGQTQVGRPPPD